jgi:hypothetical protein
MQMIEPSVRDLEAEGFDAKMFGEAYYVNEKAKVDLAGQISRINSSLDRLNEAVAYLLKKQGIPYEK